LRLAWGLAFASGCTSHNPLYSVVRASDAGSEAAGPGSGSTTTAPPIDPNRNESADAASAGDAVADGDADADSAGETVSSANDAGTDAPDGEAASQPDGAPIAEVASEAPAVEVAPEAPARAMSGLVGYWNFDEKSGTVAYDSSGNGLHGTLENLPAAGAWVSTPRGGGLSFPVGATSAGVRVGALDAVSPLITGLTRFTLAAWTFRTPTTTLKHTSVISRQSQDLENKDIFNLTFDGPGLRLYLYPDRPTESVFAEAPLTTGAAGGEWLHVAATFDGHLVRLYVDGVLTGTPLSYERPLHVSTSYPLYLGTNKNPKAVDQPFEGILDEVMLFSEPLDAAAIAKLRDGIVSP
jgi:hypothetical protein